MRHFIKHNLHARRFCTLALVLAISIAGLAIADEGHTDKAKTCDKSAMTLKPFADVEKQQFDWGWIAWTMNGQIDPKSTMTFGVVYLKPHQTNTFHVHPNADEILHVIEGTLSGACLAASVRGSPAKVKQSWRAV